MQKTLSEKTQARKNLLTEIFGGLTALLALVVMIGWHTRNLVLTQFFTDNVSMTYNSAFCLLLSGIALICLQKKLRGVVLVLGLVVFTIAFLTCLQFVTHENFGIDQYVITPFTTYKNAYPGRMAVNTTIAFMLLGLSLVKSAEKNPSQLHRVLNLFLGMMVVTFGLMGTLGYLTGTETLYALGYTTRMACHTGLGFVLIGIGIVIFYWHEYAESDQENSKARLPLWIGFGILMITVLAWNLSKQNENKSIAQHIQSATKVLIEEVRNHFTERRQALVRMQKRWESGGHPEFVVWQNDALNYKEDFHDFQSIEWVDSNSVTKWVVPLRENEAALGLNLNQGEPLMLAKSTREGTMIQIQDLAQGDKGFRLTLPLQTLRGFDGFIVGVFKAEILLRNIVKTYAPDLFVQVDANGQTIFTNYPSPTTVLMPIEKSFKLLGDSEFVLKIWPKNHLILNSISSLPELILMSGFVIAFLAGLMTYFFEQSRTNAKRILQTNLLLQEEIKEKEKAHQIIERKNQELERSNKELEQFAYVASHDLQEPLRKVSSFTELLQERCHDRLDEKTERYMFYIVDGAKRMQNLIKDLLSYSRVGRGELKIQTVNLQTLVQEVLRDMENEIQRSKARVSCGILPEINADAVQMRQLLQNLVSNALKYRGPEAPEIDIEAKESENGWEISVRDNGIGIDPQYKEKIFVIFQRLHSAAEYEGTGIGLAICKKIVERHGGKIDVFSESGRGANFVFSLPKKAA